MKFIILSIVLTIALMLTVGCINPSSDGTVGSLSNVSVFTGSTGVDSSSVGIFLPGEVKVVNEEINGKCVWSFYNASGLIESKEVVNHISNTNFFLDLDCQTLNWSGGVKKSVFAGWDNYVREVCSIVCVNDTNGTNCSEVCSNVTFKANKVPLDLLNKAGKISKYIGHTLNFRMYYLNGTNRVYFNDSCYGFRKVNHEMIMYVRTECNVPTTWVYVESNSYTITIPSTSNNTNYNTSTPNITFTGNWAEATRACTWYVNDTYNVSYDESVDDEVETTMISSSLGDGVYTSYINCSNGTDIDKSTVFSFTVDTTYPVSTFVNNTPANNSWQVENHTEINISIEGVNLNTFVHNWNGTNYTFLPQELMHFYSGNNTNDTINTTLDWQTRIMQTCADNGLVLAMSFENKTIFGENYDGTSPDTVYDYSSAHNNGTTSGSPVYNSTDGKYGGAFKFDGTGDYVSAGSNVLWDTTSPGTVEFWFYSDAFSLQTFPTLITMKTDKSTGFQILLANVSVYPGLCFGSSANFMTRHTTDIPIEDLINQWVHVALVYVGENHTASSGYKLYVNGVSRDFEGTGAFAAVPNVNQIGRSGTTYWDGLIDEVRIYNRSLSADEIKMHYYSNIQKFNDTQWYFYTNVTDLVNGTYTYFAWANDSAGNSNYTVNYTAESPRYLNIGEAPECTPDWLNTSWSDWSNLTCEGDNMNQSRNLTEYDNNSCVGSSNTTYFEYQLIGPDLVNTSWSLCYMNNTRYLIEYDIYGCKVNVTYWSNCTFGIDVPSPSDETITNSTPTIYVNVTENNTDSVYLNWNGTSYLMNCTNGTPVVCNFTLPNQTHGNYTFNITVTDLAGNNVTSPDYWIFIYSSCECTSCAECNIALSGSCSVVTLVLDIIDYSGTCINQIFNDKTFTCDGNTIDGSGANVSNGWSGVFANGQNNITIANCNITDFWNGVYFNNTNNSLIENNTFTNQADDVYIVFGYDNTINNNTCMLSTGTCIHVSSDNSNEGNNITNNTAVNCTNGIIVSASDGCFVYGNNVDGTSWECLGISSDYCIIEYNTLTGCGQYGINNDAGSFNNYSFNNVTDSGLGVYLFQDSDNNTFTNNSILEGDRGIYFSSDCNMNLLINNSVCSNTVYDINDNDTNDGWNNSCRLVVNWNDTGVASGCNNFCGCVYCDEINDTVTIGQVYTYTICNISGYTCPRCNIYDAKRLSENTTLCTITVNATSTHLQGEYPDKSIPNNYLYLGLRLSAILLLLWYTRRICW